MTMSSYLNAGVLLLSCVSGATPTFAQNIGLLEPTLQTQVYVCENSQSGCIINKSDFWANRSGSRSEQEGSIMLAAKKTQRGVPDCFKNNKPLPVGWPCSTGRRCDAQSNCSPPRRGR
jgi:hypothetical protein